MLNQYIKLMAIVLLTYHMYMGVTLVRLWLSGRTNAFTFCLIFVGPFPIFAVSGRWVPLLDM